MHFDKSSNEHIILLMLTEFSLNDSYIELALIVIYIKGIEETKKIIPQDMIKYLYLTAFLWVFHWIYIIKIFLRYYRYMVKLTVQQLASYVVLVQVTPSIFFM